MSAVSPSIRQTTIFPTSLSPGHTFSDPTPPTNPPQINQTTKMDGCHRRDSYTAHLPSPPPFHIPPQCFHYPTPLPTIDTTTPTSPFHALSRDAIFAPLDEHLDWHYHHRHRAQRILSFLILGPFCAAKDPEFFHANGVTMLLAVKNAAHPAVAARSVSQAVPPAAPKTEHAAIRNAHALGIPTHVLAVPDAPSLASELRPAVEAITAHLVEQRRRNACSDGAATVDGSASPLGTVFIACNSGNDRSAAVLVAFLLDMCEDMPLVGAMKMVQQRRFCVALDDQTRSLLAGWLDIIKARRDVVSGGGAVGGGGGEKRMREEDVEPAVGERDDVVMREDGVEQVARGFAPFEG